MAQTISILTLCFVLPLTAPARADDPTPEQVATALKALSSLEVTEPQEQTNPYAEWTAERLTQPSLTLKLDALRVTRDAMAALSVLPNIEGLEFSHAELGPGFAEPLSRFAGLTAVSFESTTLDESVFKAISEAPRLGSLSIVGGAGVTDAGVAHLAAAPKLKHLTLRGALITGSGFEGLTGLEYLNLHSCRGLTEAFGPPLLAMDALAHISLHHAPVSKFYDALETFYETHPHCKVGGEHWARAYARKHGHNPTPASGESDTEQP